MLKAMANSLSGLRVHQQLLDVTAQNIANVNTVSFKEKLISFQELPNRLLAERRLPVANEATVPPRSGMGAAPAGITASFREAPLKQTGRHYDLALAGEGFFRVIRPDGSYAYTRCGNFGMDEEGKLVTAGGDKLDLNLDWSGEEEGECLELKITPRGAIYLPFSPEKIGEIPLYRFTNPQGLLPVGENLFLPGANSGPPQEGRAGEEGFGSICQGYLENSNVDLGGQMLMLIRGQRALQGAARTLTVADELWAQTLNLQV